MFFEPWKLEDWIVAFSGVGAIALMGSRKPGWRRWGGLVGLVGQPYWLISALREGEGGRLVVSVVITALYAKGAWHGIEAFFRREPVQEER